VSISFIPILQKSSKKSNFFEIWDLPYLLRIVPGGAVPGSRDRVIGGYIGVDYEFFGRRLKKIRWLSGAFAGFLMIPADEVTGRKMFDPAFLKKKIYRVRLEGPVRVLNVGGWGEQVGFFSYGKEAGPQESGVFFPVMARGKARGSVTTAGG
jgi:hypothetical protein